MNARKQFAVGQIWMDRSGDCHTISSINTEASPHGSLSYPVFSDRGYAWDLTGAAIAGSEKDLIRLESEPVSAPATLRLEVGKTYVTADGTPVKIESEDDTQYPMNGSDGDCYMRNGRQWNDGPNPGDLIAELQEPGAAPVIEPVTVSGTVALPDPVATQRAYFLDEMMLALVRGRTNDTPSQIADAFLALADARARR